MLFIAAGAYNSSGTNKYGTKISVIRFILDRFNRTSYSRPDAANDREVGCHLSVAICLFNRQLANDS